MKWIGSVGDDEVVIQRNRVYSPEELKRNWKHLSSDARKGMFVGVPKPLKLSGNEMLMLYFKHVYNERTVPENWVSDVLKVITSSDLTYLDSFLDDILSRSEDINFLYREGEEIGTQQDPRLK